MDKIDITFSEARNYLKEGDALLYRGQGLVGWGIKRITRGIYSHVSVASEEDTDGGWESVQFREFKGAESPNLKNDIYHRGSIIDVFRPVPKFTEQKFNPLTKQIETYSIKYDGKLVTRCMKDMTGLPYGYNRIYFLWRYYTRPWYDWTKLSTDDTPKDEIVYPVCSTALSHCFSKNGFDLLHNRSDEYMSPSDFALSPRINYLFTITK